MTINRVNRDKKSINNLHDKRIVKEFVRSRSKKMSLIDWIKRRKNITYQESDGINLAIYFINQFEGRTFTFKGSKKKYFELGRESLLERIQEELDSMLILYRYTTRIKKYTDRKGFLQVEIKLVGKANTMNRYNPLDIELDVKTEMPNNSPGIK